MTNFAIGLFCLMKLDPIDFQNPQLDPKCVLGRKIKTNTPSAWVYYLEGMDDIFLCHQRGSNSCFGFKSPHGG